MPGASWGLATNYVTTRLVIAFIAGVSYIGQVRGTIRRVISPV